MVKKLAPMSDVFIAVKANTPRGLSVKTLAKIASQYTASVFKSSSIQDGLNSAINNARAGDLILCTGSHYIVGDIILLHHKTPN
jgi:folylpolyglutamate synthase/dihydropteroate synthase